MQGHDPTKTVFGGKQGHDPIKTMVGGKQGHDPTKTVVGGKQGHANIKIFLLQQIPPPVSCVSSILQDSHKFWANLAIPGLGEYDWFQNVAPCLYEGHNIRCLFHLETKINKKAEKCKEQHFVKNMQPGEPITLCEKYATR